MDHSSAIIALDFDGTMVKHEYPNIGEPLPMFLYYMDLAKELYQPKIILWTCRSGKPLEQAVEFCAQYGIDLWGVNANPQQHEWSTSAKAYATIYIDDRNLGIPTDENGSVDWTILGRMLLSRLHSYYESQIIKV